jgi:hypothetical protein
MSEGIPPIRAGQVCPLRQSMDASLPENRQFAVLSAVIWPKTGSLSGILFGAHSAWKAKR